MMEDARACVQEGKMLVGVFFRPGLEAELFYNE